MKEEKVIIKSGVDLGATVLYLNNKKKKRIPSNCEQCNNYVYDEDYECYTCEMDLDEDEMARFLADEYRDCPYYIPGDEYLVVRKQM